MHSADHFRDKTNTFSAETHIGFHVVINFHELIAMCSAIKCNEMNEIVIHWERVRTKMYSMLLAQL